MTPGMYWNLFSMSQHWAIIGSDNGLAPSKRQAIIWTNDDLTYHLSLELIYAGRYKIDDILKWIFLDKSHYVVSNSTDVFNWQ